MLNIENIIKCYLLYYSVNNTVNETVSRLEQENKELKEELNRRMKIKNSIDVEYMVIE